MVFSSEFIDRLKEAKRILFFTGAGISAESGISTFRGQDGLWQKFKPEELANFNAFRKNPGLVWDWYQYRRKIINDAKPNPGHVAIAQFKSFYDEVSVVTQNVDNLHRRAGSENIYELHGNIERNFCADCGERYDYIKFAEEGVPKCKSCSGFIRPDVVWFGEYLPQDVFAEAEKKASQCDICFVVGTSGIVYPAAYIPLSAKNSGAYLVEVNIERTEMSDKADCTLIGKSGEILPQILDEVNGIFT